MTAGSTFANTELRVLLLRSLDIVARTSRITSLTVFVDDVAIEAVGTRAMVLRQWIIAKKALIACFLALRLEFSDTKNTIIAYPQSIAYEAREAIPDVVLHACLTGKSLGAGIGAGARRCASVSRKRLRAFAARRDRYRMLRRAGVANDRLLRTGGIAAMTYGAPVMGVPPQHASSDAQSGRGIALYGRLGSRPRPHLADG